MSCHWGVCEPHSATEHLPCVQGDEGTWVLHRLLLPVLPPCCVPRLYHVSELMAAEQTAGEELGC